MDRMYEIKYWQDGKDADGRDDTKLLGTVRVWFPKLPNHDEIMMILDDTLGVDRPRLGCWYSMESKGDNNRPPSSNLEG